MTGQQRILVLRIADVLEAGNKGDYNKAEEIYEWICENYSKEEIEAACDNLGVTTDRIKETLQRRYKDE